MAPNRSKTVNGHKIEQYLFDGDQVVYVDGDATTITFDEAIKREEAYATAKPGGTSNV